jgi:hypothetical protein
LDAMRAFVGQQVQVILDYDVPAGRMTGVLMSISDEGDVVVSTDMGRQYGWPCLAVKPCQE